jgi:hypothetical protein
VDEVRSDEARAAGDQEPHQGSLSGAFWRSACTAGIVNPRCGTRADSCVPCPGTNFSSGSRAVGQRLPGNDKQRKNKNL